MQGAQFKCSTSFLPIPFMPESERMHFGCGIVKAGIGILPGSRIPLRSIRATGCERFSQFSLD